VTDDGRYTVRTIDTTPTRTPSCVATEFLVVFELAAGAFFCFATYISLMGYAGGVAACDYAVGKVALYGMFGVTVVSTAASIATSVILRVRHRRSWPVPLIGISVMTAAFG